MERKRQQSEYGDIHERDYIDRYDRFFCAVAELVHTARRDHRSQDLANSIVRGTSSTQGTLDAWAAFNRILGRTEQSEDQALKDAVLAWQAGLEIIANEGY